MNRLKILGIPFNFGQPHTGVAKASQDLKNHGLIETLSPFVDELDYRELNFKSYQSSDKAIRNSISSSVGCKKISDTVENLKLVNYFLLTIGGDHGMALGTIHGLLKHRPDTVVVWADAHGDINTPESSPSGNFHGMPLAFLLGLATHRDFPWIRKYLLPEKLILVGPRDLDQGEKEIIRKYHIQYFSSEELNTHGAKELLEMALHRADPTGQCPIHLSFDVDLFDQVDIQSTGTRVANGPKLEEVFLMGGYLAQTGRLHSMDIVEFNPDIGTATDVHQSRTLITDFIKMIVKESFTDHTNLIPSQVLQRAFSRELIEEYA